MYLVLFMEIKKVIIKTSNKHYLELKSNAGVLKKFVFIKVYYTIYKRD